MIMRYREFYAEGISRADAEKYAERLKQAKRNIECDERARHSLNADEWTQVADINDENAFYALDDRLERLQREKLRRHLIKKHGSKITRKHIDGAYDNYKLRQHRILLKHKNKD